ncbi:secretin N-terminal domain-containing protein [Accumulibacter sp.]|uniref:secretin N-terminal domain-containing protein n=1 Tax=Accumulibacter sp. TaxID=2053492 RepID=UPI0025C0984B|nr:secretin N-terminal domain-containing protein [Accumulibacter sp.]
MLLVRRYLPVLWFALLPVQANGQQEMEIIPLRHRTLDQVLPALQPLLEPGGALSGMNDQVIVRASRRNREQIRQTLAAIDTPARRLLIRVSQNRQAETRQQGAEVAGRVVVDPFGRLVQPPAGMVPGGTKIEIRRGASSVGAQGQDWRGTQAVGSTQTVQVVEGGRALIQVGQSLPLPLRQVAVGPRGAVMSETVVYRDLGQGFYAAPRLAGDRVTLEISPQFDSPGSYGSIDTQRLSTTVSGRLGEWIELGGSSQQTDLAGGGSLHAGSSQRSDRRNVWLLVEELP